MIDYDSLIGVFLCEPVRNSPLVYGLHNRFEADARRGQGVLCFGKDLCIDGPCQPTVPFHTSELAGQELLGHATECALQLGEACDVLKAVSHYDPLNVHHGVLLVHNDDIVKPNSGFRTHPHRDMEIVTWVLDGELDHKDSEGYSGIIYPGLAQRMSAGTGIRRSEMNL